MTLMIMGMEIGIAGEAMEAVGPMYGMHPSNQQGAPTGSHVHIHSACGLALGQYIHLARMGWYSSLCRSMTPGKEHMALRHGPA
jgi:hypothetical protein